MSTLQFCIAMVQMNSSAEIPCEVASKLTQIRVDFDSGEIGISEYTCVRERGRSLVYCFIGFKKVSYFGEI
jgi:hypothetical protein